jgi:aminoglycoside phosphotransferase (APT) family kinase protein
LAPDERARVYDAMNAVMAALHNVDWQALRLADFGRPGNYCARQVSRWTKQYRASETQKIAAMEALIEWLPAQLPQDERVTIVHGDFRLENMLVHATLPKVLGLIDWELATLGDPLADLAHNAMLYHLPAESFGGFVGLDLAALGIPSEAEYVAAYCRRTGRDAIPQWRFYMTFALFRMAAILQGVYARGLQGNASSPDAQARGVKAALCAERGWALAQS